MCDAQLLLGPCYSCTTLDRRLQILWKCTTIHQTNTNGNANANSNSNSSSNSNATPCAKVRCICIAIAIRASLPIQIRVLAHLLHARPRAQRTKISITYTIIWQICGTGTHIQNTFNIIYLHAVYCIRLLALQF